MQMMKFITRYGGIVGTGALPPVTAFVTEPPVMPAALPRLPLMVSPAIGTVVPAFALGVKELQSDGPTESPLPVLPPGYAALAMKFPLGLETVPGAELASRVAVRGVAAVAAALPVGVKVAAWVCAGISAAVSVTDAAPPLMPRAFAGPIPRGNTPCRFGSMKFVVPFPP